MHVAAPCAPSVRRMRTPVGLRRRPTAKSNRRPSFDQRVRVEPFWFFYVRFRSNEVAAITMVMTFFFFSFAPSTFTETTSCGRAKCDGSPESPSRDAGILLRRRATGHRRHGAPNPEERCSCTGWDATSIATTFSTCSVCTATWWLWKY